MSNISKFNFKLCLVFLNYTFINTLYLYHTLLQERWNLKQEQNRVQSLQTTLEEERKLWTEQQARERFNIEKIRVCCWKLITSKNNEHS